jgi:hypothetical protein
MPAQSKTRPMPPQQQRDELLNAQREANQDEPRNFKEDALEDKLVSVEPDGTGPTPTETFDPAQDRQRRHRTARKPASGQR